MLEDLDSWMGDLFIFIESLIDHATGVSVDLNLLKEWISMDLSPFIDTEHVDSLGLYIPLSRARTFSFSGPSHQHHRGYLRHCPNFFNISSISS